MSYHVRTHRAGLAFLLFLTALLSAQSTRAQSSVLISEFRYNGPNGTLDEFVEIYNNTSAPITVGPSGWAVVTGDAPTTPKFIVPAGTVIPRRGHFLGANILGYSLVGYPAGNGTTATPDATYTDDIPDNVGIAIFNTTNPAGFTLANRFDAVGTTLEPNALFKEGAGLPSIIPFPIDYSFVRHIQSGCFNSPNDCGTNRRPLIGEMPHDSNDNAADFMYVEPNATDANAGARIGAPGPENLSSPRFYTNADISATGIDRTVALSSPPNRVRDFTPVPNGSLGTLSIRRRLTNLTPNPITRLRFRVIDITIFPVVEGTADVRGLTSLATTATSNDAGICSPAPAPCTLTIQGLTLEEPPIQDNGGGWNSTFSAGTITLSQPLAPGQSINIHFLLGVEQSGYFRYFLDYEALPF
jgi:hypothetical protein